MFQGEGMGMKGPQCEKGKQCWTWEVGVVVFFSFEREV